MSLRLLKKKIVFTKTINFSKIRFMLISCMRMSQFFFFAISRSELFSCPFTFLFPAILLSPLSTFHIYSFGCAYMHAWESKGFIAVLLVEITFTSLFYFWNIFDFLYWYWDWVESNAVLNHTSDNKIGRPRTGCPIVFDEYDYRPNWTTRNLITN